MCWCMISHSGPGLDQGRAVVTVEKAIRVKVIFSVTVIILETIIRNNLWL